MEKIAFRSGESCKIEWSFQHFNFQLAFLDSKRARDIHLPTFSPLLLEEQKLLNERSAILKFIKMREGIGVVDQI